MVDKAFKFKTGDSVKVKANIHDPDLGGDINGWIGRILEIEDQIVTIQWDSITLLQIPDSTITHCEQEGLDWSEMRLYSTEVEHVPQRDTVADVNKVVDQIQSEHQWEGLGKEGSIIQAVLKGIDPGDYDSIFKSWEKYLQNILHFPFGAEVSEFQEGGYISQGNKVKVLEVSDIADPYGILVAVSCNRSLYHFPLCDLEVVDENSPNYEPIKAYAVWFANR